MFEIIPLVNADLSIPDDAKCQEASIYSREKYIPCYAPAKTIVDNGDRRPYYMCDGCGSHNVHNRGGKFLAVRPDSIHYKKFMEAKNASSRELGSDKGRGRVLRGSKRN